MGILGLIIWAFGLWCTGVYDQPWQTQVLSIGLIVAGDTLAATAKR